MTFRRVQKIIDSYNHDRAIPEGNQPIQLSFNFDKRDNDEQGRSKEGKDKPKSPKHPSTGVAWQA